MAQETQRAVQCSACRRTFVGPVVPSDRGPGVRLPPHRRDSGQKGLCFGANSVVPVTTQRRGFGLVERGIVVLFAASLAGCACRPCPPRPMKAPGTETWAEYIATRPCYKDLHPDASHPGWPGRGQVCGGGKCE
jgi:hypothetical protein